MLAIRYQRGRTQMAGFIGPVLPPTISIEDQEQAKQNESTNSANEAPPSVEGCQPCSSTCPEKSPPAVNRQNETFGPALPVAVYGPALPLHITQSSTPDAQGSSPEPDSEGTYGGEGGFMTTGKLK